MPVVYQASAGEDCRWGLWQVDETADQLRQALSPNETDLAALAAVHHPQKQREFMASRLLARQLVESWGVSYGGVAKLAHDKPALVGLPFGVSLAHTSVNGALWAAAIVHHRATVGIDLDQDRPQLRAVQHKFLSDGELAQARAQPDKLALYWCAKEVLYKMHPGRQVSFRQHLRVEPFVAADPGQLRASIAVQEPPRPYTVYYRRHGPLVLAFAVDLPGWHPF